MATVKFDTRNFLTNPFDFVAPPFPDGGVPDPKNLIPFKKVNNLFKSDVQYESENSVRMPIKFTSAPLASEDPAIEYVLPNEPLITIRGRKNTVETALYGKGARKGTVKELMSLDSYHIHVLGFIYNINEDDYPDSDVRFLRQFFENQSSFSVSNRILDNLNISLVTMTDFQLPRNNGDQMRWQWYSLDLVSDQDFELELL